MILYFRKKHIAIVNVFLLINDGNTRLYKLERMLC